MYFSSLIARVILLVVYKKWTRGSVTQAELQFSIYLKKNGLYPFSTYYFLPSYTAPTSTGAESLRTSEERSSVAFSSDLEPTSTASDREVCKVCGCSFKKGETSLRCEQNHEYQQNLLADCTKTDAAEELDLEEKEL